MAEHSPALAHHFEDVEQQYEAASLGMWVFLVTEIMFFAGLFTTYVVYRSLYAQAFAHASNHLDLGLGAFNTSVLIGSSLTMALAVHAAQEGRRTALMVSLVLTILLGGVFLGVKVIEYADKFHHSLVPGPHFRWAGEQAERGHAQIFFAIYFALTGVHALHMVVGIGILTVLLEMARRGRFSAHYSTPVELSGLYWHFVDIVWIFLFPLLYLIGRH